MHNFNIFFLIWDLPRGNVYLHELTFYIKREIIRILYIKQSIKNSEMRKRITFPRTFKYAGRIHNVSRDNLEHYLLLTFLIRLYLYYYLRVHDNIRIEFVPEPFPRGVKRYFSTCVR